MSFWRNFWPRKAEQPAEPSPLRNARPAQPPIPQRIAMIVHNPRIPAAGNQPLQQVMGWHDPQALAAQYSADLHQVSGGIVNYQIVEQYLVDGFPAKIDGFRYTPDDYWHCLRRGGGFHQPDAADYPRLLAEFDLVAKVEAHVIDEVWLFGFPYAGYYESMMVGQGACWCNAPPLTSIAGARRRFVVMGFNYERDVGCMLENFGHRVESIMAHVYRHMPAEQNLWAQFTQFDRDHPGRAACGNVHFAPNSVRDYDWGNPRSVWCSADAWYDFPARTAPPRMMNARDWGNGDMRLHHLWWFDHLPRVAGATAGIAHNWWRYVLAVDSAL
jgi:hypothetical protein